MRTDFFFQKARPTAPIGMCLALPMVIICVLFDGAYEVCDTSCAPTIILFVKF